MNIEQAKASFRLPLKKARQDIYPPR